MPTPPNTKSSLEKPIKNIIEKFNHHMNLSQCFAKSPLIHIGYPKCLSSWLQKNFFAPHNGYQMILGPLETQISIIDPPPFRYTADQAESFIKQKQPINELTPVISAEALAGNMYCGGYNAQLNADRLKSSFPNAKILIIIREQRKLIRSLYKTQINWGMPQRIDELLNPPKHSLSPLFNLEYLKFDGLISYYHHLFGPENVLVLPYELFLEKPHYFVQLINKHSETVPAQQQNYSAKQIINQNRPLIDIYADRLKNMFTKTSFNYLGPLAETEDRINNRLKKSKKNNRFPKFTHSWFEKDFQMKTANATKDAFAESNRKTELITKLSLQEYGYQ